MQVLLYVRMRQRAPYLPPTACKARALVHRDVRGGIETMPISSVFQKKLGCFFKLHALPSNHSLLLFSQLWKKAHQRQPTTPPHLQLEAAPPLRMDPHPSPKLGIFFSLKLFLIFLLNFSNELHHALKVHLSIVARFCTRLLPFLSLTLCDDSPCFHHPYIWEFSLCMFA
jgi:hypothetical protein